MDVVEGPSGGEAMLGGLIDDSHNLEPDHLTDRVRFRAAQGGFGSVEIFLADKQQRSLMPYPEGRGSALDISTTLAGRAFRLMSHVHGPGRVVWFPLLNGTHRVGVMSATVAHADEAMLQRGRQLAGLVAHLIVTKNAYGDAIEQAQRREDMTVGAEFRWSLLPPLTFICDRVAVAGALEPAYQVAGDAFDYALNGDTLHLAVFDAMGHGLTASRLVNLAIASYRHSRRRSLTLEETYRAIDEVVAMSFSPDVFVTAQLLTLDLPTGGVRWINAGHPEPLILRGSTARAGLGAPTTLPIGLAMARGDVADGHLEPDDLVLFYSDGVTEARSPSGEEFGLDRLSDLLVKSASGGEPLPEIARRLTHAVLDHQQGHLDDDATLLLLHWPGRTARPVA